MKVVLYVRVSTDEQAKEGVSILNQRERLISYVKSQEDWEISDIYIDDGYSAKDTNRPELQRLINDISNTKIDVVLVYKLDRLTRSVKDLYNLLEIFNVNSTGFRSAQEAFDTTTPMGRAMMGMLGIFAQWERETISERVRDNMEQIAMQGKRPGAPLPFGYDKEGNIVESEANILRVLRDLYMDGSGFLVIARRLNEMSMMHRGLAWSPQYVKYCLENPYYAGMIQWGKDTATGKDTILVDGDHDVIFTRQEFEKHSERLKVRSIHSYTKIREYWFAGLMRCGRCGAAMVGRYHEHKRVKNPTYKKFSYMCTNKLQRQGCNLPMFRQDLVEKLVLDYIGDFKIQHEEIMMKSNEEKEVLTDVQNEIEQLNKELRKIIERKKKWQYAYAEGAISSEDLKERTKEDRNNEEFIQQRIEELEQENKKISDITMNILLEIPELWEVMEDKEKNELLHTFISSIVVDTPLTKVVAKPGQFIPATIQINYK